MAEIDVQKIHDSIGPVQEILDQHDGIVNVIDTSDGNVMISLEGGCTGCSSTPMTAMQIYYSLMKLEEVNDVVFVNGELPPFMRQFIDQKLEAEDEVEGE
jgi:Fe-S cluster biogenesis protein NfuA